MVDGDIPAGLSLCRAAGWNQIDADWELFLRLSPHGCRVAVDEEGHVRGTVTTVRYQDCFSWIGMVIVDPTLQRQGIGIQLLRESLQILSEEDTIKLDATPAGRKIYLQLDFVDEYPLSRMEAKEISPTSLHESSARPVLANDLPLLLKMDHQVFGAGREPVLSAMQRRNPQYCFRATENENVSGYCFGRSGHDYTQIGPVIADNVETAKDVVSAALRNCAGNAVVMDVLHHTPEWKNWLTSLGFTEQRPLVRMYRGANAYPGIPGHQFAILGPELG